MADKKVPAEAQGSNKVPAPPNPDVVRENERVFEYKRRVHRESQAYRKSRYPPFNIEHLQNERHRLAKPMTNEDRFLRKQWLADQNLLPSEPRHVEVAIPRNGLRRMYMLPWDTIGKGLAKIMVNKNIDVS